MKNVKIISTLGPSSSTESTIRKMMLAGMDVARLNFSHGNYNNKLKAIAAIRELNRRYRRRMKILGDLEGHRIRIGALREPVTLAKRKIFWLAREGVQGKDILPFDYEGDLKDIKTGTQVYIDDGAIALEVIGQRRDRVKVRVVVGGLLKAHKGVNIPGAPLHFSCITRKDRDDILFCLRHRLDYIAQSFVRNKHDITGIKNLLKQRLRNLAVIAKIENQDGVDNIEEILKVSDGIMIARGDLGVSLPIYEVPVLQKELIKKCRRAGKFTITATQMLESMTENLRPTRAEVSDVANAVIDGSDYLMLSAETAVGAHPVEAVRMMDRIIKFTQSHIRR